MTDEAKVHDRLPYIERATGLLESLESPRHTMVARTAASVLLLLLVCIVEAEPTNSLTRNIENHASGVPNDPEEYYCYESTTLSSPNSTACTDALNQIPNSRKELLWGDRSIDKSGHDFDARLPKWYLSCKPQPTFACCFRSANSTPRQLTGHVSFNLIFSDLSELRIKQVFSIPCR